MRYEDLKRYTPSAVPGDKGRGLIVTLEPSDDGEAVLVKDLPQKIAVSEKLPEDKRLVCIYFEDSSKSEPCFGHWAAGFGWFTLGAYQALKHPPTHWRKILC